MRLFLLSFLLLIGSLVLLQAQDCDPPNPPSNRCEDAPVVCDLEGWCGNSGGYTNTSQPNAFCGIVENNCWVSFRAYTTFLEIEVSTSNCFNNSGVQAQMFYTEDCQFFESVSNCLNPVPANDSRILVANGLIPGTIYHIMVDGKGGDFCDFRFKVLAGLTSPLADLQEEYAICELDTFRLGDAITFIDAYTYFWSTEDGNFVGSADGPTTLVDTAGTYLITVIDKPHACIDTATVEVIISPPPVIDIEIPDTLDCGINTTVLLDASNSEFTNTISWERFDGDVLAETLTHSDINIPGWYYLTLVNELGCENIDSIEIISKVDFPIANAGLPLELDCLNEIVYLNGTNSSVGSNYEYEWLTPNGNIITTIDDLIIGADEPGLYTLLVTNTDNACISGDPVIVTENSALPTGAVLDIHNPCFGATDGSINIQEVIGGTPPYTYDLDTFSNLEIPFYQNLLANDYPLTITDEIGCTWDTILTIVEGEEIVLNLGANQVVDLGDIIELTTNLNREMEQINWSPDPDSECLNCEEHTFVPLENATYVVQAIDANDCVAVDSVTIEVIEKEKVYIPNAFSPNADGINDVFMVFTGNDVSIINEISIYDRWGNHVFSQKNIPSNERDFGWDGFFRDKKVGTQVFVYLADISFINGVRKIYKGDLTVLY